MGDLRYYTYGQFFGVVTLTFITAVVIFVMVSHYYRQEDSLNKTIGMVIYLQLLLASIFRVIEWVHQEVAVTYFSQTVSSFMIIGSIILLIVKVGIVAFKGSFVGVNGLKIYGVGLFTFIFLSLTYILSIFSSYDVLKTSYGMVYMAFLIAGLVLCLIFMLYSSNRQRVFLGGLFITTGSYLVLIVLNVSYIDWFEYLLLITLLFITHRDASYTINRDITDQVFNRIGDLIQDYVLVIDREGTLIYSNQMFKKASLFKPVDNLLNIQMVDLFDGKAVEKKGNGNSMFIQVVNEDTYSYYTYKRKNLMNDDQIIGEIVTIIDISDLFELVNTLELRKSEAEKMNEHLKVMKANVYDLEKEKSINKMLTEILSKQEAAMIKLSDSIDQLANGTIDDDFENRVEAVIDFNEDILAEVRKVVSGYRAYFGGAYD